MAVEELEAEQLRQLIVQLETDCLLLSDMMSEYANLGSLEPAKTAFYMILLARAMARLAADNDFVLAAMYGIDEDSLSNLEFNSFKKTVDSISAAIKAGDDGLPDRHERETGEIGLTSGRR